ncbi:pectate lyase [Bacteroides sp. 51]|uniref:pectate lyase n=1 Tax=Bacteroides sp. 51 TaxID=2302938 RepID=UPI0013D5B6AF|nr:pectate lyase [Bacteroides sp. 51]NDV83030.1 pectate lyase [Bacteroides sp. 51]
MKITFRSVLFVLLSTFVLGGANAQEVSYKEKQPYKSWTRIVQSFDDNFYHTKEATRIAENVLLYQQTTGGWPKNIYMAAELNKQERKEVLAAKDKVNESTIDNNATITEIYYLARVYQTTKDERYKKAVIDGIQYLLNAQYGNGGWPQFWPRPKGYYTEITYNDNAMINVMELLREIYEKKAPYDFIPNEYLGKARAAFDKGVECILKTQYKRNGKLTVWCAQHDHVTLEPIKARAYELPSLSGQESDNIVLLLMSLPNPSSEIINAVEGAVEWFKASKIEGIKKEFFTNDEGKRDYRIVECTDCPPLWARFYDLETNRPFFSDRDGVKVYALDQIGHERRNGYSWYNSDGMKVLKMHEKWRKENN